VLRAEGRHRHQPLRSRYAAPVGRYRPDLSACCAPRRIPGRDRRRHEAGRCADRKAISDAKITTSASEGAITRLIVRQGGVQTKIEVTPVLRGSVYDPQTLEVSDAVESAFGFGEMQVVSFADLYAGKIIAALDRQHPRDLFDVRDLLANEGIDDDLRKAFIVYLLSHGRPMSEVLAPTRKDISEEFLRGFEGMTKEAVSRDELIAAREALIVDIAGNMPDHHRRFLVSFERGEPDWAILDARRAAELPAVKWRQQNLDKLPNKKRAELVEALEKVLFR
jgi:hypothetical protein